MGLVEEFVDRYRREQDFYEQAARIVKQTLEARIQAEGVRAIVTYRVKQLDRLESKVRERATRKRYESLDDIYNDIVDLAGVRVALYFPGQRLQAGRLIEEIFAVIDTRHFPVDSAPAPHVKRFSGYAATHYRVRLPDATLSEQQKRYREARIEIQIASVLMHAWSEVEHDLVYKPLEGELTIDEYSVLDELNGLVIAGELALERLQRAGESRVALSGRQFANHYELGTHLLKELGDEFSPQSASAAMGRVDRLFDFLHALELAKPDKLNPYLAALHGDFERRPIAEQIVDQLLAEDGQRYRLYEEVSGKRFVPWPPEAQAIPRELAEAIGQFMQSWIDFESAVRARVPSAQGEHVPIRRLIERLNELDAAAQAEIVRIRRMRNNLVHGIETPAAADLREAAILVSALRARVNETA